MIKNSEHSEHTERQDRIERLMAEGYSRSEAYGRVYAVLTASEALTRPWLPLDIKT
jgi:uncharacterized protein YoaH (UPF0181 family)